MATLNLRTCLISLKDCEDGSVDCHFDFVPAIEKEDGAISPAQAVGLRMLKLISRIAEKADALEEILEEAALIQLTAK